MKKTKKLDDSIALEQKDQSAFTKKVKIIKGKVKKGELEVVENPSAAAPKDRAIIYVGHIPHGFFEKELRGYFSQFGKVVKVVVPRSKKSGRPRGYGYVEFEFMEVAQIAAETMNNYLMFDKRLDVQVLPQDKCRKLKFGGGHWAPGKTPYLRKLRKLTSKKNEDQSEDKHLQAAKKQLSSLNKKLKKLSALGVKHTFKPVDVPESLQSTKVGSKTAKPVKVAKAKVTVDMEKKVSKVLNTKKPRKLLSGKVAPMEKSLTKIAKVKKTAEIKKTKAPKKNTKKAEVEALSPAIKVKTPSLKKGKKAAPEAASPVITVKKNPPKKAKAAVSPALKLKKASSTADVAASPVAAKVTKPTTTSTKAVKEATKISKKKDLLANKKATSLKTSLKKKDKVVGKKTFSKDKIAAALNDSSLVTKKSFKSRK